MKLNEVIEDENSKIHGAWEEKRRYNTNAVGKKHHCTVDVSAQKQEEDFGEFYNEGDVILISDFLASRGHDPRRIGDIDAQISFATEDQKHAWDGMGKGGT